MAGTGIGKIDSVTSVFNGQSDIVVFSAPEGGYDAATLSTVTAAGVSLGQVVEDSTSWDGDEPTISVINDEQGDAIVASPSGGSFAFSCDVASTSKAVIELFFKGSAVTTPGSSDTLGSLANIVKFGTELPVITRPIAIFNDEANKFILFPKAKIIANLNLDSKLWRVHISATAEYIDTTTLGTVMIGSAKPKYNSEGS